jgi:hypothetical protein
LRIDFVGCWGKDNICAGFFAACRVGIERSRIFVDIFGWAELCRINENAYDDEIGLLFGGFDKREMSIVQSAHRRYKADCFA